jgi:hypothetical protein
MKARKAGASIFALVPASVVCFTLSGFDYFRHSIPLDDISGGGLGKDGISSIDNTHFLTVAEADQALMRNEDRVLGFVSNDQARAYPNWHETVNDRVGGNPVVISFCLLCGTGMVFDAHVESRNLKFGVSGLLYQSDMLLTITKQKVYGRKLNQRP